MRLAELAGAVPHARSGAPGDPEIDRVAHDSRRAAPGTLFAAFPGQMHDGRAFLKDALARGASAALGEPPAPPALPIPYLEVTNPREAAGLLAARLCGEPSRRLVMVGVTGTSGKTTVTLLLDAVLARAHPVRGLFGTLVYRGGGAALEAARTTPEATDLQPMLKELVDAGGTAAAMECSSHALALSRLAGCSFDVAIFTNLSRDHLDFHGDMEGYFESKRLLFRLLKPGGVAVVNSGDPYGARLAAELPRERVVTFALAGTASGADVSGAAELLPGGIRMTVARGATRFTIESALLGAPNAENLLAAAAAGLVLDVAPAEIAGGLASVSRVPGRLEPVPNDRGLTVLVDYAHKPGALEGVLKTVRSIARAQGGRVIALFGCGGDRDRGKRPEMGRIAAELADEVVVTSDNPRSEDPQAILDEIRPGVLAAGREARYFVDRRDAIAEALRIARPGDVVLLAGKGHETTQIVGAARIPFDDRVVARELLAALAAETRG